MKDKISRYALYSVGILSGGILLLALVRYVVPVLSPFIIAWLIATVTDGPARRLSKGIKAPARIIRLLLSLLTVFTVASGVVLIIWQATAAVWAFLTDFGEGNRLYELISTLFSRGIFVFGDGFPEELAARISETVGAILSSALSALASGVTAAARAIPQAFLFLIVTVISLIYFALDYDRIGRFVASLLPERTANALGRLRGGIISVLGKYVRSYSLIMLITYITIFLGLTVLGAEHAAVIALFVAILDLLPIIGVGTVLIPWGIFELATGNQFLGVGLIILFVVNAVIRQLAEPKIIGKSLDLHPILTLMMIYVGYSLFGVAGLIFLPVLAVCISIALKKDDSAEIA